MSNIHIKPLGKTVLLESFIPEKVDRSIILVESAERNEIFVNQVAVVLAIGPLAWRGEDSPRAKVGDKVLVTKYSGYLTKDPVTGKEYRIVNDTDIFAKLLNEGEGYVAS
jgi:co-chaperonin GroES (HSP10)